MVLDGMIGRNEMFYNDITVESVEDYNNKSWSEDGDMALIFLNREWEFRKFGYVASYKNCHYFSRTKKEALERLNKSLNG